MADTTRRTFLRSYLAPVAGGIGGGLLLPLIGKGALALAPEATALIPVVPATMPFSVEALQLRELRRRLYVEHRRRYDTYAAGNERWRSMVEDGKPLIGRIRTRPAHTWTDCVELAEEIWCWLPKAYVDREPTFTIDTSDRQHCFGYHRRHEIAALVEGVLTVGNGERFDRERGLAP